MSEGSSAPGDGRLSADPSAPTQVPKPCIDIFVSYASHDTTVANAIVETLERIGIRCWIAPRDVTPGSHYADGIMLAISRAKALVLILSASALASKHVGKEVERVSSKGRPIIVLRTDAAPLTPAFEYFLSESQWMDVRVGGVAAITAKLVEAIQLHIDFAAAAERPGQLASHSSRTNYTACEIASGRQRRCPLVRPRLLLRRLALDSETLCRAEAHCRDTTCERQGDVGRASISKSEQ